MSKKFGSPQQIDQSRVVAVLNNNHFSNMTASIFDITNKNTTRLNQAKHCYEHEVAYKKGQQNSYS
jgi:hypothetical protein